jgi:hypothetical protein
VKTEHFKPYHKARGWVQWRLSFSREVRVVVSFQYDFLIAWLVGIRLEGWHASPEPRRCSFPRGLWANDKEQLEATINA